MKPEAQCAACCKPPAMNMVERFIEARILTL